MKMRLINPAIEARIPMKSMQLNSQQQNLKFKNAG